MELGKEFSVLAFEHRRENWKEETKSGHDTSGKWEGWKILLHPKKEKKILPFLTVICLYSNVAFHSEGPCDYTFSL